jgi:hypothetical protein
MNDHLFDETFFSRRLGMFIHWGIYAIPGWQEQHQLRLKTPRAEYARLATQFNPTAYDPDAWLDLAEAAGMTYLVVFGATRDGVRQLWVANADGSVARPLSKLKKGRAAMHAHWQPIIGAQP